MSNQKPRFNFDCSRCKFNWNCGPAGDCFPLQRRKLPEPPEPRKTIVAIAIWEWRNGKKEGKSRKFQYGWRKDDGHYKNDPKKLRKIRIDDDRQSWGLKPIPGNLYEAIREMKMFSESKSKTFKVEKETILMYLGHEPIFKDTPDKKHIFLHPNGKKFFGDRLFEKHPFEFVEEIDT